MKWIRLFVLSVLLFSCTENPNDEASLQKIEDSTDLSLGFEGESIASLNERLEAKVVQVAWPQQCYRKKENRPITQVVLHNTVVDLAETMNIFKNCPRKKRVSIHYIVDKTGLVHKALEEKHIAHHALSANELSIGIEIVADSPNSVMPPAQEKTVIELTKDIMRRHNLKIPERVLANSESNPSYGLVEVYAPLTTHRVVINGTTTGAHTHARQGTLCPSYVWPEREQFLDWRREHFSDLVKTFSLTPLK